MLPIFRDDHVRHLIAQKDDAATDILQQPICPHLSYRVYNVAIKTAETNFGIRNARFRTYGTHIGAATAQLLKPRK